MMESDKLKRDIETMLDSIRREWRGVAEGRIARGDAVETVEWCIRELTDLLAQKDNSS